jgi:hypothetical protein
MMKSFFFVFALLIALPSCRKAADLDLVLRGQVNDYRNNSGVKGVRVKLDEQVLQSGALSGAFVNAGEVTTDHNGYFELVFDRKNALNYRLTLSKEGYFSEVIELNPDNFRPNEPYDYNAVVIPEAFFTLTVRNVQPDSSNDLIRFRKLNALFDCLCCNNEFDEFYGASVDTSVTCRLYGDHMLTYTYDVLKLEETTVVDSIYCPAFHTTELVIEY